MFSMTPLTSRLTFWAMSPARCATFWAAGCVDELLVYVAPVLLGAGPAAVPDLGIGTIGDAARLRLVDLARVGPDVRLRLVPIATASPDLAHGPTGTQALTPRPPDVAAGPAAAQALVPAPSTQED